MSAANRRVARLNAHLSDAAPPVNIIQRVPCSAVRFTTPPKTLVQEIMFFFSIVDFVTSHTLRCECEIFSACENTQKSKRATQKTRKHP